MNSVTPDYFRTLGITLLRGRAPDDGHGSGAIVPVVVSESLARALLRNRDPLGELLEDSRRRTLEIVGVARDTESGRVDGGCEPWGCDVSGASGEGSLCPRLTDAGQSDEGKNRGPKQHVSPARAAGPQPLRVAAPGLTLHGSSRAVPMLAASRNHQPWQRKFVMGGRPDATICDRQNAPRGNGGQKPGAAENLAQASKELEKLMQQMSDSQSLQAAMEALERAQMSISMSKNWSECQGPGCKECKPAARNP